MLKAMLHVIVPSLLFMGCTQTLPECKSDEDKQRGCAAREYHKNGRLERETPYKDNKRNGVEKGYHENGRLKSQVPYKDGKVEGVEKLYHENG
ncbi:MAG: hypothetical protein MR025_02705 [Helicobacter trogontum]|nr:hypothetical protein [Helicobacter trogontum]MCI5786346.1 hypothetical protein [Helicobacter trogontum]